MKRNAIVWKELCTIMPGGVNSPVRACMKTGSSPLVIESAKDAFIRDVEEKDYIDYCCSWGAIIHGHANSVINANISKRMQKGLSFGTTTEIEGLLAKKIAQHVPSCEMIRFVSTGTEATMSAVRLARACTNKKYVIKFEGNYHGHSDQFLIAAGSYLLGKNAPSTMGVPDEMVQWTISLPYNDVDAFEKTVLTKEIQENLACVIIEPVAGNMGVVPAKKEFLEKLRRRTTELGALLIFDEVITGFRVALGGAQSVYKITPDLTCFGKIIGGGLPVAAFGGKKTYMELMAPLGPVFQAGTLSGNPLAIEAGLTALTLLETPGFYEELEHKASMLIKRIESAIQKVNAPMHIQRYGSLFSLFFTKHQVNNDREALLQNEALFYSFFRFMLERGVYIPPSPFEGWFITKAHTIEQLNRTADLFEEFVDKHCC